MSRVFAYCRVSTHDQTTENQVREIKAAGFSVTPSRVVAETISGGVPAGDRPGFALLRHKLEAGDVLVVTKLDRLGRNAMDVRATVEGLAGDGIRVHCLPLSGVDLTSAAGKMTMGVIAAVAEFERDLLRERTASGLARAKASGKPLGRPRALGHVQVAAARIDRRRNLCAGRRQEIGSRLAQSHGIITRSVRPLPCSSSPASEGTAKKKG